MLTFRPDLSYVSNQALLRIMNVSPDMLTNDPIESLSVLYFFPAASYRSYQECLCTIKNDELHPNTSPMLSLRVFCFLPLSSYMSYQALRCSIIEIVAIIICYLVLMPSITKRKRGADADFRIQVLENLEEEISNSPTHIPRVI